jgi:hypothetical protein
MAAGEQSQNLRGRRAMAAGRAALDGPVARKAVGPATTAVFAARIMGVPGSGPASSAPEGPLADSGAGATVWLLGGAGLLPAAGAGVTCAACRTRTDGGDSDPAGN